MIESSGLYAIVDPDVCGGRDPVQVAEAILRGGAGAMQLRMKRGDDRDRLALAKALRARCAEAGVPFVVDDRPDIALLSGADGVHLGQRDLPVAEVAEWSRGRLSVGASTHSLEQVREAEAAGADLLGFGPVFATRSKENADPTVGLRLLAQAVDATSLPIVAIGGLDAERAAEAFAAGARMVACISAVCLAPDPERAAREIHARGARP